MSKRKYITIHELVESDNNKKFNNIIDIVFNQEVQYKLPFEIKITNSNKTNKKVRLLNNKDIEFYHNLIGKSSELDYDDEIWYDSYSYMFGITQETYLIGSRNLASLETLFIIYYLSDEYEEAEKLLLKDNFNFDFLIGKHDSGDGYAEVINNFYVDDNVKQDVGGLYEYYRNHSLFSMLYEMRDRYFLNLVINHPNFNPHHFLVDGTSPFFHVTSSFLNFEDETDETNETGFMIWAKKILYDDFDATNYKYMGTTTHEINELIDITNNIIIMFGLNEKDKMLKYISLSVFNKI